MKSVITKIKFNKFIYKFNRLIKLTSNKFGTPLTLERSNLATSNVANALSTNAN